MDKQKLNEEFDNFLEAYHADPSCENLDALRLSQKLLGTFLIKEKAMVGSTQAIVRFFDDCKLTHKNKDVIFQAEFGGDIDLDVEEIRRRNEMLDFYQNDIGIKSAEDIFELVANSNWSVGRAKAVLQLYKFKNEIDLLARLSELEKKLDS